MPLKHLNHHRQYQFRFHQLTMFTVLFFVVGNSQARSEQVSKQFNHISQTRKVELASNLVVDAEFGEFSAPENRAEKQSNMIRLHYIRLKSTAKNPQAPLVFLAGGPGASATGSMRKPLWLKFLQQSDVILFDQRASGLSKPSIRWKWNGPFPRNVFLSQENAADHFREMSRRGKAEFTKRNIDLRGYTVTESATDLAQLCRVLKLRKISILAHSWGTHLALEFIRRDGALLENAILCGVAGPDHLLRLPETIDIQLKKLALFVARDAEISKEIPNLELYLTELCTQLDHEPIIASIRNSNSTEPMNIPIGSFGLKWILFRDLNDPSDLIVFPRLLYEIKHGDATILNWFVRKRIRVFLQTDGMVMAMRDASGVSPERKALIASQHDQGILGPLVNFPFLETWDIWQVNDLGDQFRQPVISDVRTLFVSGTLDSSTPPFRAEQVRWGFPNSTHIVIKNAGHDQLMNAPGIHNAMSDFLAGDSVEELKFSLPPLSFVPLKGPAKGDRHPSLR